MTVDNTFEGPLSYDFPDVLSTASANPVRDKNSSGWPFVDKYRMPAVIHWQDRFCTFLISAFCTNYMRSGILETSVIGCLATTSSPCISILTGHLWWPLLHLPTLATGKNRYPAFCTWEGNHRLPTKGPWSCCFFFRRTEKVYFYHKGQVQTESGQ